MNFLPLPPKCSDKPACLAVFVSSVFDFLSRSQIHNLVALLPSVRANVVYHHAWHIISHELLNMAREHAACSEVDAEVTVPVQSVTCLPRLSSLSPRPLRLRCVCHDLGRVGVVLEC